MAPSPSAAAADPAATPRRQGVCLGVGLATGAVGAVWILATHETRPMYALSYHVPLAVAFGCWAARVALATGGPLRLRLGAATLIALGLVAARVGLHWPLSGHGVLAGLIAAATPWPWLRALAAVVLVQAFATKWAEGTAPLTVIFGAAVGSALGLLAIGSRPQRAAKT